MDFVKTELMPDFDFDAFNHEEDPNAPEQGVRYTAPQEVPENSVPVLPATAPTPPVEDAISVAPAAPASQGDNMSQEEVEKW
jgi:hypothetical protein